MTDAVHTTVAVTLSVAPTLEQRVVDWLLARADVPTFASGVVHVYGGDGRGLSVAEQVTGRQRRVELAVELPAGAVEGWLKALATAFAAADIRYRVTPVVLSGRLQEGAPAA